jgi:hypothetical protein
VFRDARENVHNISESDSVKNKKKEIKKNKIKKQQQETEATDNSVFEKLVSI